ncbi:hypothetical protein JZ751_010423 [Albula glossodonta]|uniref:Secreted protein n=1 Tax=Albula glossodonta TaxID=121402 RepID=A0A8T2NZ05_9TELE|nr:hypothetical protein JZ751_010423 [Albula glossodonta]
MVWMFCLSFLYLEETVRSALCVWPSLTNNLPPNSPVFWQMPAPKLFTEGQNSKGKNSYHSFCTAFFGNQKDFKVSILFSVFFL